MADLPLEAQAARLATEADLRVREGRRAEASDLYVRAAQLTTAALARAPEHAVKSRALLMVNSAALLFKAQRYAEAENLARQYMATQPPPSAGVLSKLREIAFDSWQAQSVTQSAAPSEQVRSIASCELRLEGGMVLWGLAPLEDVVKREIGLRDLFWRGAELMEGHQYRDRGAPPLSIQRAAKIYAAAGGPGSYRVRMKVVSAPEQLELEDPTRHLRGYGEPLVHRVLEIVQAIIDEEFAGQRDIDPRYRIAFLRLVRDLAPDGHAVRTAELAGGESTWLRAHMNYEVRSSTSRAIAEVLSAEGLVQTEGTLVGMHLTTDHILVDVKQDDGILLHMRAPKDEGYEERIGALWTRRVVVSGRREKVGRKEYNMLQYIDAAASERIT